MPLPVRYTSLQPTQYLKWFDPANTSNSYTVQLNPQKLDYMAGAARKATRTTNANQNILGDREGPPKSISMEWGQQPSVDLAGIQPFTEIQPCAFIDNNDNGFLGVFCIDDQQQLNDVSLLGYNVKASFLPTCPYNGETTTLNYIAAPTLSQSSLGTIGYIPASTPVYIWATALSAVGESIPGSVLTIASSGTPNEAYQISWTTPSSQWFRGVNLYWNSTNTLATATLLCSILSGQSSSFNIYSSYLAYTTVNAPSYGTSFTGYWSGGLWVQTS